MLHKHIAYLLTLLLLSFSLFTQAQTISTVTANSALTDIWSDGTTMWVLNDATTTDRIFAYTIGGGRDMGSEFDLAEDNTNPLNDNGNPSGIWSDTNTMWVADNDDNYVYAYNLSTRMRDTASMAQEFALDPANGSARGIWSDGTTMWVADDATTDRIFAYNLRMRVPDAGKNITLDPANGSPRGIWSDKTIMWVADVVDNQIYAYNLRTGARIIASEFATQPIPQGIWSNGDTIWVTNVTTGNIFSNTLPVTPVLREVTAVPIQTMDTTPDYTFHTTGTGTITYTGSGRCTSMTTGTVNTGTHTITFTALAEGDYAGCTITVTNAAGRASNPLAITAFTVDNTAPMLIVDTAVQTPTMDLTPEYIFHSDEAGDITYGGSCTSGRPAPAVLNTTGGSTTVTYDLVEGTYNDCTIVVRDAAGNDSAPLMVTAFTINAPPEVQSITRMTPPTPPVGPNGETNADTLTWEVVFSEPVNNVDAGDFAVAGPTIGIIIAVTGSDGDTSYEVEVSGLELIGFNGTVTVAIDAGHDIDDLIGNDLTNLMPTGDNESYRLDNAPPEVTNITRITRLTLPAGPNGETNEDTLTWEVVFNEPVNNVDDGDFAVSGTTATPAVTMGNNGDTSYQVTASGGNLPSLNATVSLSIVAGHNIMDLVGNDLAVLAPPNPQSYEVDNIAPDLSVFDAIDTPTNDNTPDYIFNSDQEWATIAYGGFCDTAGRSVPLVVTVAAVAPAMGGSTTITYDLPEGVYNDCTITVTDAAGNTSAPLAVDPFTIDNSEPELLEITRLTPPGAPAELTNSGTLTWSVVFNEPVNNVDGRDFAVSGTTAGITAVRGAGTSYEVEVSGGDLMDLNGTVTVAIDTGNDIADIAGNDLMNLTPNNRDESSYTLENMEPTVASITRMTPIAAVTNSGTLTWVVAFSEGVNNVDMTDFAVSNTTGGTITVTGSDGDTSYEVTASGGDLPTLNGTVTLSIDTGHNIADPAGNRVEDTAPIGANQSYRVDNKRPIVSEVTAIGGISTLTDDATPEYVFRSDEAGAISYGGACSSQTGTATAMINTTITFHQELAGTFEPLPEGDYTDCTITVTDAAGNISAESPVTAFTVDTIPTVDGIVATNAADTYGIGDIIAIEVTFTEVVVVNAVTGTPVLSLNNDAQAFYSSGSGTKTITFNYIVSPRQGNANLDYSGTNALSLAGGTINDDDTSRDANGNLAILTLPDPGTDGLRNDGSDIIISAPGVEQVSGMSDNYRTGDIVTIQVQFSEPVMVSGGGDLQLELETGDIDRMAVLSGTPAITSNILALTYTVEEGDKSRDLAYTAIDALVAVGGASVTSATGEITDLNLPALGSSSSLSGSSDIIVGIVIEEQNARLNEILLPKIAQAMSAATVEAITRRIENGGGDGQAAASSSLSSVLSSGISNILPSGLPALKDMDLSDLSWLKSFAYDFLIAKAEQSARSGSIDIGLDNPLGSGFDIKRVLGNSEFVMPLNASGDGTGSGATSSMVLWGSGDYNNLSDNDDGLDYDGDIYSINVGIDSQISQETLLGISVNWSNANFDYRDATTVQTGDYGYKLYGINPYISWSPQGLGGSNLWATVGYGIGEIESQIDGIEKVETDTRQYQFSGGGRYILSSSADSLSQLSIKGDLTLLRVDIDQSAGFLGNDVDSQSFRLLLQGSSVFNYAGYSFTPSLEGGLRYDLGDGDTGGGIELSPAFTYKSLDDHILIEGRGRYLIAGQHDQWGLSVLARIDQARHGRGLSFSMHPTWGQSQGQAEQLTAHNGSRFNDHRATKAEAQMKTELSYGMHVSHILGQTMLLTPYAEFTLGENARYYQFGQRLSIGELLNLSFKLSHHQRRGYADDNHLGLESAINF